MIAEMSKANSCTMSVVPTSPPSMAAKAMGRTTKPRSRKPASINAVAVLLCKSAVTAETRGEGPYSVAHREPEHLTEPASKTTKHARLHHVQPPKEEKQA